jgi:protein ImuB
MLLTAGRDGARRLVMAVDARAASLGLRPGMAVTQAQAMLPDLRIMQADPQADHAALRRLAAWCLRHFSPLTAADPPDGLWIDVTGCAHLFPHGEAGLLAQLTTRLAQAGIAARAAIADTPGAAHALARFSPTKITIALKNDAQAELANLPVAALRLPEETVQALRSLGFDRIAQLIAAPRAPLTRRFGPGVFRRLDQALGAAPEPIEPAAPAGLPRTRLGFPDPIATPEDLARATTLLTERLCEKLAKSGLGAARLDLVFQRVDGVAQMLRIGTNAPSRDAPHLIRLLTAGLETIDPGFGIDSMMLCATLTGRLAPRQTLNELCAAQAGPDLSALVDILMNRLGQAHLFRLRPVESDVPERSLSAVAPLARPTGATWPPDLPRPPRLFTPPRRIEAIALLPDHAPVQFIWRRRAHRIRRADGPERIFGEWWKNAEETEAFRDYFQIEDESGQRFWLFRRGDLVWFLHGTG